VTFKRIRFPADANQQEIAAAVEAAGGLEPGALVMVEVSHDPGCPKLLGLGCRCQPTVTATVRPPVLPGEDA
jgi:hypothetical protein